MDGFQNLNENFLNVDSNLKYSTQNIINLNAIVQYSNDFIVLSMNICSLHKHFNEFFVFF